MKILITYYSLEALATALQLPQRYLRELASLGEIPAISVNGRLRFNPLQVQAALDRMAESYKAFGRVAEKTRVLNQSLGVEE